MADNRWTLTRSDGTAITAYLSGDSPPTFAPGRELTLDLILADDLGGSGVTAVQQRGRLEALVRYASDQNVRLYPMQDGSVAYYDAPPGAAVVSSLVLEATSPDAPGGDWWILVLGGDLGVWETGRRETVTLDVGVLGSVTNYATRSDIETLETQ